MLHPKKRGTQPNPLPLPLLKPGVKAKHKSELPILSRATRAGASPAEEAEVHYWATLRSPNRLQPKADSHAGGRMIRRGEGGWRVVGRAFMVARWEGDAPRPEDNGRP